MSECPQRIEIPPAIHSIFDTQYFFMRGKPEQLSLFPPSMGNRPVTLTDLELYALRLKVELLKEIKIMLHEQPQPPVQKWLKNKAAAAMLGISVRTLQDLRDKGIVPHSRIGRIIYYDPQDIQREIERRKGRGRHHPEYYKAQPCEPLSQKTNSPREASKRDPASRK